MSYNEYGLTTWKIGNDNEKVGMQVVEPHEEFMGFAHDNGSRTGSFTAGDGLTFTTKDAISVDAAADDADHVCYDVGIGLPVIYGGMVWGDEDPDNPNGPHSYDGYYDTPDNPDPGHVVQEDQKEKAFVFTDKSGVRHGATITAVIKGDERDALGLIKPAADMHGKPMITESETRFDDLENGIVTGFYSFRYMYPDKQYEFYIELPTEDEKTLYKLTQTIDSDPVQRAGENDGKYDGWTNAFTTVIPVDPVTKEPLLVRDHDTGYVLHREPRNLIDFGVISASANRISGTIWDDSTDVQTRPDKTAELYDGVQRGGAQGIGEMKVLLYAYGWVPNPDPDAGVPGEWRALRRNKDNDVLEFDVTPENDFDPADPFAKTATPSDAEPIASADTAPNGNCRRQEQTIIRRTIWLDTG